MDKDHYLSRQEACTVLHKLAGSGILSEELKENLDEIANLISYELDGEHFWGQTYESGNKLRVVYRDDLWTDELVKEVTKQHENARFIPAKNEVADLKEYFYEMRGVDEESDFADQQQCEKDFMYHYGLYNIH